MPIVSKELNNTDKPACFYYSAKKTTRETFLRSPKARIALSFSLTLLIHRILYRFFVRLRANLRTDDAKPFRDRNPRFSQALTSRYAPVVGASLAGAALGICPESRMRVTIAIYLATRSLEFLYNALNEKGYMKYKPWWFGSWLLMPLSYAQLFHAFIFDRETMPKVWFINFLLDYISDSHAYIWVLVDGRCAAQILSKLHFGPTWALSS